MKCQQTMGSHAASQELLWIKTNKTVYMCKTNRYVGRITDIIKTFVSFAKMLTEVMQERCKCG
jgi:hypothetical protein